jgi:hypothetical protein
LQKKVKKQVIPVTVLPLFENRVEDPPHNLWSSESLSIQHISLVHILTLLIVVSVYLNQDSRVDGDNDRDDDCGTNTTLYGLELPPLPSGQRGMSMGELAGVAVSHLDRMF